MGWRDSEVIALDTEFVRERTFFPQLGLVQIGVDRDCFLVDAVLVDDLSPLAELLVRPETLKVVHSGGEDLEVLAYRFGSFPSPLFDTQIAATLAGLGGSLSYQRLVHALFRLELPKGETRSDWLRRPLSAAQLEYAVLDVAYLLPAHRKLSSALEELGRTEWAEEEFDRLASSARLRTDPEYSFRRLDSGAKLTRRERALLRELSSWREGEARRRDVPRGFVVPDRALMQLVRRRPTRRGELAQIGSMKAAERTRSGDEIVRRIGEVMARPESSLPAVALRSAAGQGLRARVDSLRAEVQRVAEEMDMPPEFLARRRAVEELVRDLRAGSEEPLPDELRGWRRAVIGERLLGKARDPSLGGAG
jgi:ribonuclease D